MKKTLLFSLLIATNLINAENNTPQKKIYRHTILIHNPFTQEAKLFKAIITDDVTTAAKLLNDGVKVVSQFPCNCTPMELAKSNEMRNLLKEHGLDKKQSN